MSNNLYFYSLNYDVYIDLQIERRLLLSFIFKYVMLDLSINVCFHSLKEL